MARLLFHVGGPAFHPVAEQAQVVRSWLAGTGHEATLIEGNAALELLPAYDLLVLMGLFHPESRSVGLAPLSEKDPAYERVRSWRGAGPWAPRRRANPLRKSG